MRPYTLVAELTYRCPLACVYCSNPIDFAAHANELDTERWQATYHRVDYDIDRAAGAIEAADLPKHLAKRLYVGR